MPTLRVFAALALIFVIGAAPAQAGTLRGYTHRNVSVRIKVDAQGYASRVVFRWHVPRCDFRRYSYRGDTVVTPDPERFFARGPYTVRSRGGFRSRVMVHSTGRKLSIYRWKGTFSVAVTIRRHGRVVDRCHIRRLHWTAS